MDMELLQKALFSLPRLQGGNGPEGLSRSAEKLGQLYSVAANSQSSPGGDILGQTQQSQTSNGVGPSNVEPVSPNIVFDVASLVLYGTHAVPVRLKILLDRLFSVLSHEEVIQILKGYGWSLEDYQRGYILKDPRGAPLERWQMCSKEEEPLVLQQFLRFGETRPITQGLILQELSEKSNEEFRARSEIKKLIERNSFVAAAALSSSSGPQQPVRSSPSPQCSSSSPNRRSSPALTSPQGPSPPSNGGPPVSPLNKLQNMTPFDYRGGKDHQHQQHPQQPSPQPQTPTQQQQPHRKTPEVPSSMRIPPTSMAAGLAGLPPMLPGLAGPAYHHHHHSSIAAKEHVCKKDPPPERRSPVTLRDEEGMGGLVSQEIRKKMRDNIGISYVNPATGKKRVQCNVCLKTFCDKGALKIHFSAVHLREMHKCSVEGCNMMFSSRRSRNRHSANPNPKLHTPHLRRKISPHDGRTHQGPSIIPYHAAAALKNGPPPFPQPGILPPGFNPGAFAAAAAANQLQQMELQRLKLNSALSHNSPTLPPSGGGKRIRLSDSENESKEESAPPTPAPSSGSKGRKRKSQNPTRLKVSSDGGEEFSSDDDDEGFENPMDDIDDDEDEDPASKQPQGASEEEHNNNGKVHGSIKVLSDDKLLRDDDEEADFDQDEEEEIPLDSENPRRCVECSVEFDNHFQLKAHFTTDHLKLIHKCSIEGCNAGFPSKRSRDRHSANSNLHRKLLSTEGHSSAGPLAGFPNEVMARLYGSEPAHPLFFGMPFFGANGGHFFRPPLLPSPSTGQQGGQQTKALHPPPTSDPPQLLGNPS